MADIIHARIVPKIEWNATLLNSLTASSVPATRTPISLPADQDCIETIWNTTGRFHKQDLAIEQFKQIYESDIGYRDVAAKVDAYYSSSS